MQFKKSLAINGAALVVSSTLVGISIASIYFAGNADEIIKHYFPPGFYRWVMSRGNEYFNVGLEYNRSSEIKTLISSALTLVVGLSGVFASGLLHKHPNQPKLLISLLVSAIFACVVTIVCVSWAAVAEVNIKHDTCWFNDGAIPNHTYTCSIENAACNALRFTDHTWTDLGQEHSRKLWEKLDTACLQFRHARFMLIPLAVFSLVLAVLYAAELFLAKRGETEGERADARVRSLQQDD